MRLFSFQIKQNDHLNGQRGANLFTSRIHHKDHKNSFSLNKKGSQGYFCHQAVFYVAVTGCIALDLQRVFSESGVKVLFYINTPKRVRSGWWAPGSLYVLNYNQGILHGIWEKIISFVCQNFSSLAILFIVIVDRRWSNCVIKCPTCLLTWPLFVRAMTGKSNLEPWKRKWVFFIFFTVDFQWLFCKSLQTSSISFINRNLTHH